MNKRKGGKEWRSVYDDEDFAALFAGATVKEARGGGHDGDPMDAIVVWTLTNGRKIAMSWTEGSSCPTCGYDSFKSYYTLDPDDA